jgi:CRP-like cAMP-binding protein
MIIREIDLFKGIASHIIDEIAQLAVEEGYPKGTVIFKRGDFAESLYILEEGRVDLLIYGIKRFSFPLTHPGYVFGWSALVEPKLYTATAECIDECKVIKLDGTRLMHVFEKHPLEGLTIMKRLAGVVGMRLDKVYKQLTSK